MEERKYDVIMNDTYVAKNMTIDNAMVLVKGLFEHYCEERSLRISIQESAHPTGVKLYDI